MTVLRETARRLGIGHGLLTLRHHAMLGVRGTLELRSARKSTLPEIRKAAPAKMPSASATQVHMLLGHSRIDEALWSLLSLNHFADAPVGVVIHDDGTITADDAALLAEKLPGLRLISRAESDAVVEDKLFSMGLTKSVAFRKSLFFARKMFDPNVFARDASYVLIDSDVVFFSNPVDLLGVAPTGKAADSRARYSVDNGYRYSLSEAEMSEMIGRKPTGPINAGVLRLNKTDLDFSRIERYLTHPGLFRENQIPDYYAEMTIYALELTIADAQPLPLSYAVAPPIPTDREFVAGHYCGGIMSAHMYYTRALPMLGRVLLHPDGRNCSRSA
ncbi:MAG TPA: hypothetical protein VM166_13560 [Gemmatimonadaceae bacterium]|nr:hypothetical protein [Gemmatimonadaceae bacterium]